MPPPPPVPASSRKTGGNTRMHPRSQPTRQNTHTHTSILPASCLKRSERGSKNGYEASFEAQMGQVSRHEGGPRRTPQALRGRGPCSDCSHFPFLKVIASDKKKQNINIWGDGVQDTSDPSLGQTGPLPGINRDCPWDKPRSSLRQTGRYCLITQ